MVTNHQSLDIYLQVMDEKQLSLIGIGLITYNGQNRVSESEKVAAFQMSFLADVLFFRF